MPYQTEKGTFEKARRLGHVPIVESEFVKERLQSYRIFGPQSTTGAPAELLIAADSLSHPDVPVQWAMSFDGSLQEVATSTEYPSTRVNYLQVVGVLVHLNEMLGQASQKFVDPAIIHNAIDEALLPIVLPGSNVCRNDMDTVRDSWRAELFELLSDYEVEGRPLLDMYLRLLAFGERTLPSGEVILERCSATRECSARHIAVPSAGIRCPACGRPLFPTDGLRIHEEVQELASNATAVGRLMTFLEQLIMLSYVHFFLERQPRVLSNIALVIDGPLALFGPPAPLKRSVLSYLHHAAAELSRRGYSPPLLFGVEKTGQFAEHAAEIAKYLPNRTLMRLPDDYIFTHILATRPMARSAFGEDTYYGRKFFYKTARGQMLVVTVPSWSQSPAQVPADDPARYETLPRTLTLLDEIGTSLYKDAIIPVALAHSYAAIPLKTGSKVLTLLARTYLGQPAE